MSLLKWFGGENDTAISDTKKFIQLIRDNQRLEEELNIMHRAFKRCGEELYKRTGDINHYMPEHWMKIIKYEEGVTGIAVFPSIECPQCKMVSYNTNDVEHKYCGNCHQWHADMKVELCDKK